jgi:hypothetical protein
MGLLDTQNGRDIMQNLVSCYLAKRRMSRRFKRSFWIAFNEWKQSGEFSLETLLNDLNPTDQTEITQLSQLLVQLGCSTIGDPYNGGIYNVNSVTGSDETGDGSVERPFASLAFLTGPNFPKVLDYKTVIAISGDVTADELLFHQEIGPNGSLSLVGAGDPNTVTTSQGAGPFTLTGVTQVGTPVSCNNLAVADVFASNELYGKWLLFQTGDCAGQAIPIHRNDPSNIFTRAGLDGTPSIGDTFIVVQPASSITCPKWDLQVRGGTFGLTTTGQARFNIMNLNLDIRSATFKHDNFRLRNTVSTSLSFVSILSGADQYGHIQLESDLNACPPYDTTAYLAGASGVINQNKPAGADNAGLLVWRESGWGFGYDEIQVRRADAIRSVDCRGRLTIKESIGQLNTIAIGTCKWDNGASGALYISYVSGDVSGPAIELLHAGSIRTEQCYLEAGLDAFKVCQGMLIVNGNDHGTFTGYGFRFCQGLGYVVTSQDPASWVGTTGAIYFAGGVGTTAFPAGANARVTDTIANFFGRIEAA